MAMQSTENDVAMASEQALLTTECIDSRTVAKVAAMLDLDQSAAMDRVQIPRGWHFCALAAATPRSELRSDGYPGLGVPMPDLGLPRLLQAGREVWFCDDIGINEPIRRESRLAGLRHKGEGAGARCMITVRHELFRDKTDHKLLVEDQTFVLMPPSRYLQREQIAVPVQADVTRVVTPDATMLFQYSALGFNSHKIHLDRQYATEVEGFPDLVVNGGLVTLLVTEFLRQDLQAVPARLKITNRAPLFCDRPITLAAVKTDAGWQVRVHDNCGQIAAEAEWEMQ